MNHSRVRRPSAHRARPPGAAVLAFAVALAATCSACAASRPREGRVPLAFGRIETLCGSDSADSSADANPVAATAARVRLSYPVAVACDSGGRILVVDTGDHRVYRIDPDGRVTTILGGDAPHDHAHMHGHDHSGAVMPHHPYGIAVAADGSILVAGNLDPRVYRLPADGSPAIVIAGTDSAGFGGDGGPAAAALLNAPLGVAVARDGTVFVADTGNHRIRRIGADGTIGTIAGTGEPGFSGDGGPARAARLSGPIGVSVDPRDGSLLIADTVNDRIRRLGPDGTITTVAGSGERGFSGDGGPAIAAKLAEPEDARVGPDGLIYLSDSGNHRVRRIRADGAIETIAGDGASASRGDGGDPRAASIRHPSGLAFDAAGNLVVAEAYGHRVRRVTW